MYREATHLLDICTGILYPKALVIPAPEKPYLSPALPTTATSTPLPAPTNPSAWTPAAALPTWDDPTTDAVSQTVPLAPPIQSL